MSVTLPPSVLALVAEVVRRHPQKPLEGLVSEVVSTLAGTQSEVLLALVKTAGTFGDVVTAIAEAVERAKGPQSQTA